MKILEKITLAALFCCTLSCSTSNKPKNVKDSLALESDSVVKANIVPFGVKDPAEDLNFVVGDIITTLKSNKELSRLNKYIYPKTGFYYLYSAGNFSKCDKLEQLKTAQAGANVYDNFCKALANVDTTFLSVKYDLTTADECKLKKKGIFGILLQTPPTFLSDCYRTKGADQAELKRLNDLENILSEKVVINVFDKSNGNGAEVFYFALIDKKWYLLAIDLTDCTSGKKNKQEESSL